MLPSNIVLRTQTLPVPFRDLFFFEHATGVIKEFFNITRLLVTRHTVGFKDIKGRMLIFSGKFSAMGSFFSTPLRRDTELASTSV